DPGSEAGYHAPKLALLEGGSGRISGKSLGRGEGAGHGRDEQGRPDEPGRGGPGGKPGSPVGDGGRDPDPRANPTTQALSGDPVPRGTRWFPVVPLYERQSVASPDPPRGRRHLGAAGPPDLRVRRGHAVPAHERALAPRADPPRAHRNRAS